MATEGSGPMPEHNATLSLAEPNDRNNPVKKMAQLLRKMGKFQIQPRPSEGRLQLLDLPIDILKEIISEVS